MQLLDLLDKDHKVQMRVMNYFLQKGPRVKIKELNEHMDVSYPTLQKTLNGLHLSLHHFNKEASLDKKSSDVFQLALPSNFSVQHFFYTYLEQSLNYKILINLFYEKEISITKLAQKNNLSEASVFRRLKTINRMLAEFDIQFKNKKLTGPQLQIQQFYFQLFHKAVPSDRLAHLNKKDSVNNLITVIKSQFQLQLDKKQEQMLSLQLHIMQQRLDYRQVTKKEVAKNMMQQMEKDSFYQELKNILTRFFSRFALPGADNAAVHLYLFFISEGLLPQENKWWQNSSFLHYFLTINQKIYQTITQKKAYDPTFTSFLLQNHVKITFYKGEIHLNENHALLLSDIDPNTMNQCMSIVEKSLTRKISHSQWVMLDASYGLIYDIYQRRLQKEVLIGVIDDGSLEAEEIMRFIKQSLAGMANITIKKAKKRNYDLLVAKDVSDLQSFSYTQSYLLTGVLSSFEAQRLKDAVQKIIQEK